MATPSQRNLFDAEPTPWELDEQGEQLVAEVVFSANPWGPFDYSVPDALRATMAIGKRVRVPLGRGDRQLTGYCVKLENRRVGVRQLKPIAQVVDERSLLSTHMLRLTEWMADYYMCHWGQALDAVVPAGVRFQAGTRQTLFFRLAPNVLGREAELKLNAKQLAVVAALAKSSRSLTLPQLMKQAECTAAPIQTLRKRQIVLADTARDAGRCRRRSTGARGASRTARRPARRAEEDPRYLQ